jgi:U3 small nucleolar RNA-associated protein MPP10
MIFGTDDKLQPNATIVNISNVAAAAIESALPTTHAVSTMLAPEEILTPSNGPRVRSELTPAEKRALRSKERKLRKKTRDRLEKSVEKFSKVKGVKRQKEEALKKVVKNGKGVTVVGKKSQDVLANKKKKKV